MWFVRCAIMEFRKGIFQFTCATTELFDLGMEFSGVREDKAAKQRVSFASRFSQIIIAGQSKNMGDRLNVYFLVLDDVPVALMTNKSPVWTDGTAA